MTAKIISNRSSYVRGGANGIGGKNLPSGVIGWVGAVSNANGDILYLSAADVTSNDHPYLAYSFQAVGGTVTVDFTLQNVGTSTDPASAPNAAWVNTLSVTAGSIHTITYGFAAIRVTFATKGTELYIVSR